MEKVIIILISLLLIIILINCYVLFYSNKKINSKKNNKMINNFDCILILGAGVKNNEPSNLLKDRLDKGIELYKNNIAKKIIMSGDHGRKNYDEVNIMKNYAINQGIPSEDIFMDHAGFSTYESMYRAKEIFNVKKIMIVTQRYHLYRAIYIADKLGMSSYGVSAKNTKYSSDLYREIREILARNKDVIKCIFKTKPTYLGEKISITGNGNITNDKENL